MSPLASTTIITPSFNQAPLLASLLENVRSVGRGDVRHIVIDGGSTDGSVDLLREWSSDLTWVSEPDMGQADAINKGLLLAQTEIVGWINCDDRYTAGSLDFVRRLFAREPNIEFLYGDALATDLTGRSYGLRAHVRPCDLSDLIFQGDPIVQPAAFWRSSLTHNVGLLDSSLTYAFDYEFWMRVAQVADLTYVPVCLAVEALHSGAKTSRGGLPRIREIEEVAIRHGGSGIPAGFRAEAAALESIDALYSLSIGGLTQLLRRKSGVAHPRPSLARYAAHMLAAVLPGDEAVPKLRLIANRRRSQRLPLWPSDPAALSVPLSSCRNGDTVVVNGAPSLRDRASGFVRRLASTALVYPLSLGQQRPRSFRQPTSSIALGASLPSISLAIPTLNQCAFIEETLESVLKQGYEGLEVLVQDGGSTDGTLEILERYGARFGLVTSAPDDGQADALNRAFRSASGDVMGWLNSDDLLLEGALVKVGTYFAENPAVDVVYGWRIVIDEDGRCIGRWAVPATTHEYLQWADYVPQETLFWRRAIWEKVGAQLDPSLSFAMDWDLLLRFQQEGARFACIGEYIGGFRVHAESKTATALHETGYEEMKLLRRRTHGVDHDARHVARALLPLYARAWAIRISRK